MTENTTEPTNVPPATGTEPGQQAGETKPADKTFTQAELNDIVRRAKADKEAEVLRKYGDPKEAKAALQRLREIEEAGKTEQQRTAEALAEKETRLSKAEAAAQRLQLENAVMLEALKQGVSQDRLNAALKLFDATSITRSEDGTLTGLDTAVTKLLDENPFLKPEAGTPAKPATPKVGATNPQGSGQSSDIRSWHPLYRNQGTGGFRGQVILPSDGGTKK